MKKLIAMGMAGAMSAALLAGCGGAASSAADTASTASTGTEASSAATTEAADGLNYSKLTVGTDGTDLTASLKILTQRTDLIEDGTFDKYISEFNAIYPNISIKYEGMTDYANDMTTRLTSNDWGDICMVPTTIPLTELGDYFEPLCSVSDIENDYNFASNRSFDGTVYGIPSTGNVQGIVYNKAVFEKAGIDKLPTTPDEFLDALQKIKDNTDAIPLYTNYAAGWTMSAWDAYIGGGATGDADWMNITICKYALLIFAAFIALVPIVSCVVTAFKTVDEYNNTNVMTPPKSWLNFDNFITAWQKADMGHAFLNSFLVLVCVLAGSIMISSMLAYVLNRFKFPGNGLIRNLFMIATLIPGIATQVTVYQIMTALHLVNSLPGYMLLMMGTDVITIYIFLQFFENLSVSLDESAILDGCSYFGVFFKILLPLLKPAVVTSAILKGVSTYNEYYMANLYLQDKNKYQVVSTSLYVFSGPMGSQYNYICAGVIITIIPALIIFLLCQDQIYSGMAAGAVKE